MKPIFKLKINRKDLTEAMIDRVLEIKVEDAAGYANDNCVVTIDGREPYPKFPKAGAILEVSFGYDKMKDVSTEMPLKKLGMYELADFDWDGPPWQLTLNFNAMSMLMLPKTARDETYEDTTLYEIVEKLAKRMGYDPEIHKKYKEVKIKFEHQKNMTDMEFVNALAMRYAAFPKVGIPETSIQNKKFRFQPKTGENFVDQNLDLGLIIPGSLHFHSQVRAAYGTITAVTFSYDTGNLVSMEATPMLGAEKGSNATMALTRLYDTQEKAQAAADSKGTFLDSSIDTMEFKIGGNPLFQSHRKLNLSGSKWHPDIPKKWIIVSSTHTWKKGDGEDDGYTTHVKCEVMREGMVSDDTSEN